MRLWSTGEALGLVQPVLGRLTRLPIPANSPRTDYIAYGSAMDLSAFGGDWTGYAAVLSTDPLGIGPRTPLPAVYGPPNLEYLAPGDVVLLLPTGSVNVLYRRTSEHNTILATERCNSFCLMCSQPPKTADDSYRVRHILRLLELIDPAAREIGLSGGEPTLLGDAFFEIVEKAKHCLPTTALHVLTNGRRFKDPSFAQRLGVIAHPDLMLGIPLYSDIDALHDYVVQAAGAYDETMVGYYNLAQAGVRIEIRVVLHQQTYERLPRLAEFIARNLPFVDQVALMGLEMFGFTPRNLDVLWIDPVDYQPQLEAATRTLALSGMRVLIYNHQLCTLPRSLWPLAVRSISDWKNVYVDDCATCGVRNYCGGFFQSATKRHSAHIHPLPTLSEDARSFMDELHGRTLLGVTEAEGSRPNAPSAS